jgi:hypothetical protein
MEMFILAIAAMLTPPVVAGLMGGVLGALMSLKVEIYGWRLSILFAIGSVIAAGALVEYLTSNGGQQLILTNCVVGMITGMLSSSALDSINLAAPDYMRRAVHHSGEGLLNKLKTVLPKEK